MSTVWPREAQPRTIVVSGTGTQTLSYVLPDGAQLKLESVVASIDAVADSRPTLAIAESSGVVIAEKRQGETIPAGDTGLATWALRLADDNRVALPHPIGWYTAATRHPLLTASSALVNFTFAGAGGGVDLLDTSVVGTPNGPSVKTAGLYFLQLNIAVRPNPFAAWPAGAQGTFFLQTQAEPPPGNFFSQQGRTPVFLDRSDAAGSLGWVRYLDPAGINGALFFEVQVQWPAAAAADVTISGDLSVQQVY